VLELLNTLIRGISTLMTITSRCEKKPTGAGVVASPELPLPVPVL
jgi:hypothetical protein